MEKSVIVRERQRFLASDVTDMQAAIRATMDELIKQAVGPGNYYAGFGASETGQWEVSLLLGRLFLAGRMYQKLVNVVFSDALFNVRPVAQRKIVSVIGYGADVETTETGAVGEPRQFLVNATTRETEVQVVSTRSIRTAIIDIVPGVEAAAPVAPSVGVNNVLIATIELSNSGVESVTMNEAALLPQTARNEIAIIAINDILDLMGSRIDTLVSDQAATNSRIASLATLDQLNAVRLIAEEAWEMAKRALVAVDQLDTGATYLRDFEDDYRDTSKSNLSGSGYAVHIDDGLKFPAGTSGTLTNGIELFSSTDPKVMVSNDLILPAHTHKLRVDTFGQGKVARQADLAAYSSATHNVQTSKPSRVTVTYDTRKEVSWFNYAVAGTTGPVNLFGVSVIDSSSVDLPLTEATRAWVLSHGGLPHGRTAHLEITRLQANLSTLPGLQVRVSVKVTYYKKTTTTEYEDVTVPATIDGQGRAETFLQERDGWLTQVGMFLSKKAASGDIRLLVTEVDASGAPNLAVAPVHVTAAFADLKASPITTQSPLGIETVVTIPPVVLKAGRRYAVALISTGAHVVRMTEGVSSVTQGEHWALSAANKWERPALETKQTMAIRLYFARFNETRVAVDLKPLSLAGGIQSVSVNAMMITPAMTSLAFEVQPDGSNWRVLGPTSGQRLEADLSGNPELMPFRVLFEGTQDIMPALSRGSSKSTVTMSKPALSLTHYSTTIDVGGGNTANRVKVIQRLRNFDDTPHNDTVTLVTDPAGTPGSETADAVTDEVLVDGSISRTSVFDLASGKQTFQIKTVMTASAVSSLPMVEDVYAAFFDV